MIPKEVIEKTIERIVFDFTSKFGAKSRKGENAYWATLEAYESIFGKQLYNYMISEAEKRINNL